MGKILIANDFLTGGGVETVLRSLVRYLMTKGDRVWLMIPDCTQAEISELFPEGVKLYRPMRKLKECRRLTIPWAVDRTLFVLGKALYTARFKGQAFDAAIAFKEGYPMLALAGLAARKKLAWLHTDYQYMHWTKGLFPSAEAEKACMMSFDKVVCVSHAVAESVKQAVGDSGNLCVRYNPIEWKKIREQAKEPCDLQKSAKGPLFVSVGRLAYPKNYEMLIDVCHTLAPKYDFEVWIVGGGPDQEKLQAKIDAYGLTCVKLLGGKANPFPYLQQADGFISTSLVESYGLAIQEALILGKPVIAMECPAVAETLSTDFGILVSTQQQLKEAMERFLSQKGVLAEYKRSIQENYAVDGLEEDRLGAIVELWEK